MSDYVTGLQCVKCAREFPPNASESTCPHCGREGILDVLYDYHRIGAEWSRGDLEACRDNSMWRYAPLLPVSESGCRPRLRVGMTPLYGQPEIARTLGLAELFIKDDGINPTASLKDRASAVAVARARHQKRTLISAASTGNAASSLAGLSASAGIGALIFVPRRAPAAKVAQLLIFGARVFSVDGSYDDAFDLSMRVVEKYGLYNRNCAINPYLVEGKKTAALEIAEQLHWQAPDYVVTSVGDGCILSSLYKGFHDLHAIGFIDRIPRLVAVQAAGCAPVVEAYRSGEFKPCLPDTVADSIAVGIPRNRIKALRALAGSNGITVTVSDEEILDTMRYLGRTAGIFGEPAGVAGMAGLRRLCAQRALPGDARVAVLVTGNGLKDTDSALRAAGEPIRVSPRLDEIDSIIEPLLAELN